MLIADVGGGYSGATNWFNFDVRGMWATLENQQTDGHWQRVAGWRRTHELAGTHLSRLRSYREGLIQAWPPDKSAASRAYVERLDFLIQSVEQSYEAAIANRTALSGATSAISDARRELKTIHEEYERKFAAKLEYERTQNPPSASSSPSPTPTPSPSPGPAPTPPVTQADLERLNARARSIMYGLSGELVQAQAQLKQPPPYRGRPAIDTDQNPDVYGGGSPPVIPPVVPVPTGGAGSGMPSGSPPVHHVVPAPTAPSVGPILGGNGPTLGGVTPTIPTAPTPPVSPPVITPTPPSPPGIGPGFPAPLAPTPGGIGNTYPGPRGTSPVAGGLTKPGMGGVPTVPRAMPPGGMIGTMPGMGQPGAGMSPARQINPVGGMIGGAGGQGSTAPVGGAGQRPGGAAPIGANGGQRSIVPPGSRSGRRGDDESGQQWDPDNPWETDEGVAPVMHAPREVGRIDPGPAIGFDR
ncbi:hypothetical protein [Micromonospora sp. NPDC004704]